MIVVEQNVAPEGYHPTPKGVINSRACLLVPACGPKRGRLFFLRGTVSGRVTGQQLSSPETLLHLCRTMLPTKYKIAFAFACCT